MGRRSSSSTAAAFLGVLLLAFAVTGPARGGEGGASPPPVRILVSGSGWTGVLVRSWARAYEADHPGVRLNMKGGGAGSGISALMGGGAEIAYDERPLKASEERDARQYGLLLQDYPVGLDAIAIVVDPANPSKEATEAVVRGIFAGDLDQWADLGGPHHKISLYCQRPASQAGQLFQAVVMGKRVPAKGCRIVKGVDGLRRALEKDPYGIGYARLSDLDGVEGLKLLRIGGGGGKPAINPMRAGGKWLNQAVVSTGTYPLSRTIYLLAARQPREPVQQFLDWVRSPAGQAILAKSGYIPLPGQLPPPPPDAFADR